MRSAPLGMEGSLRPESEHELMAKILGTKAPVGKSRKAQERASYRGLLRWLRDRGEDPHALSEDRFQSLKAQYMRELIASWDYPKDVTQKLHAVYRLDERMP